MAKREIDWDKVQTIDDIKTILIAVKIEFSEEYANTFSELEALLKEIDGKEL